MQFALVRLGLALVCFASVTGAGNKVNLPGGRGGIGFDDLQYSTRLHRVLVPAGRTGNLVLIDPDTLAVTTIGGFGTSRTFSGGHDQGPTSVDEGNGMLFVTDRTTRMLNVVDPDKGRIVSSTRLSSSPDYVRYVQTTHELWVTEPDSDQIEIFTLPTDPHTAPVHAAVVAVANGPESLVIDSRRGRAYTHHWQASTVALDLRNRSLVEEWQNGCKASRGIALQEEDGYLVVACSEGKVSVLDVAKGGRMLSTFSRGSGFDVIGFAPTTGRVFLAGSSCGCLVSLGLSKTGTLSFLDRTKLHVSSHCALADDSGHAWWCDPTSGSIWRVSDSTGSSR
jgi:DNA-binding beta-propeller fold protein YncE